MQSVWRKVWVVIAAVIVAACSSQGPKKPQPGTPEFKWLSAKDAFQKGDMERANQLLSELSTRENPYQAQARPIALALTHGLAHAYMNLADKYAAGAKKSRAGSAALYRLVNDYRGRAISAGMNYAEIARSFVAAAPASDVTIAFPLPGGATVEPPQYRKIDMGLPLQPAEIGAAERHVVMMEVARSFQRSMGALNEPEKAQALYQNGEAKVPATTYMLALGEGLYETGGMFGPKKLNQPNRVTAVLYEEALKALDAVKGNKDADTLVKKVKDAQKSIKET